MTGTSLPDVSVSRELGKMRCYNALGEWDLLAELSASLWQKHEAEEGKFGVVLLCDCG